MQKKTKNSGVGEMMTRWIRALVDLLKSLQYIPSTQGAVSNANKHVTRAFVDLLPSSVLWNRCKHLVHA